MNVGMGMMNPAMFARASNAPNASAQQTQVAQGGGNMFAGDAVVKKSQRERAMNAINGRVNSKLQIKKAAKVKGKKGA